MRNSCDGGAGSDEAGAAAVGAFGSADGVVAPPLESAAAGGTANAAGATLNRVTRTADDNLHDVADKAFRRIRGRHRSL